MDLFERLRFLFARYLQRQCSPQELQELLLLLQQGDAEHALSEEMQLLWEEIMEDRPDHAVDWDGMYADIISSGEQTDVLIRHAIRKPARWPYYAMALVVLLLLMIPIYWLANRNKEVNKIPVIIESPKTIPSPTQKFDTLNLTR